METDVAVEKLNNSFSTATCKTLLGFAQLPQARRCSIKAANKKTKTGHFTCYRNRTFSFATDIKLCFRSGSPCLFEAGLKQGVKLGERRGGGARCGSPFAVL